MLRGRIRVVSPADRFARGSFLSIDRHVIERTPIITTYEQIPGGKREDCIGCGERFSCLHFMDFYPILGCYDTQNVLENITTQISQ